MRFDEAIHDLDARQPERMVPDLSRITALADLLDHPELTYPTIHVTGTNGKTTTARLIARILCAHGLSTGVYTSPHLESVLERIALCDAPISEEEFAETYDHLLPFLRQVDARDRVTYFETLTALAYLWFAEKPVNAAVFEVGMGGTWDATNLIEGKVCVFTEIALDHPELGSTIEEVANEKAGIMKTGSIAVIEDRGPAALAAVEGRAVELGDPTLLYGRDWHTPDLDNAVGGQVVSVTIDETASTEAAEYRDLFLPLQGWFQGLHAATAIVASHAFVGRLDVAALREAFAGATSPGRLEVVERHPLVVLDGAHNPAGAKALAFALPGSLTWESLFVVAGCSANKDIPGIVSELARLPRIEGVHAAPNSSPRSADPEVIAGACRAAGLDCEVHADVAEAIRAARNRATESDLLLVTGSLYTVADARRILTSNG